MVSHDSPLARPNAEWISRYAAGLLRSMPGLQPLDAVRRALVAHADAIDERPNQRAKSSEHRRSLHREEKRPRSPEHDPRC